MNDIEKLEALLERGNGSIAFFRNAGKVHCVVKYIGHMRKPPREYTGSGKTLAEAIRNTHTPPKSDKKEKPAPTTMPGMIQHQEPKVQTPVVPGLVTR